MIDDDAYLETVSNILSIVKDKTVLELAPFSGWHTSLMLGAGAKRVICVEPNTDSEIYSDPRIVLYNYTANDYYKTNPEPVEVVTCMGLLYHLHSPLHLIEQILNISRPEYLIIETVARVDPINIEAEEYNIPGNAFTDKCIPRPLQYRIVLGVEDIAPCISSLDYSLIHHSQHFNEFTNCSKRNIEFAVFKRNNL